MDSNKFMEIFGITSMEQLKKETREILSLCDEIDARYAAMEEKH